MTQAGPAVLLLLWAEPFPGLTFPGLGSGREGCTLLSSELRCGSGPLVATSLGEEAAKEVGCNL